TAPGSTCRWRWRTRRSRHGPSSRSRWRPSSDPALKPCEAAGDPFDEGLPMRFAVLLVLVLAGPMAEAASVHERADSAVRWTVAPMGAVFARYPGAMSDAGGGLEVTRSLAGPIGGRWVEARIDLALNAGLGSSGTAYLLV